MPALTNIGVLATCPREGAQADIGLIENAAICWQGERITWLGAAADLPATTDSVFDAHGALVTPGLVDCHTHLAFGGDRIHEHVRRIRGESYLDIARSGGGIAVTMAATRTQSREALIERCERVLSDMARLGVTTVEAKSGYGLDLESELKLLEVYEALRARQPVDIVATLLAAHVVPPEWKHDREGYVRIVLEQILPQVARRKLAEFCDVFLEQSAFSEDEARRILERARALGLGTKLHADQLSHSGGGRLSAEFSSQSADHLEHTSDEDLRSMARAAVVAVALPLASLYTFEKPLDARRLLAQGLKVAIATDYNPGTAPSYHIGLALLLACTLNRLTPHEALKGVTIYAAQAIKRDHELGSLAPGMIADMAVLDAASPAAWITEARPVPAIATIKRGRIIHGALRERAC
jgi:imidazolonepropionase